MTLNDLVGNLLILVNAGHGNLPVYYRHGSSGDCGELSTPSLSDDFDDMGPFDCPTEEYIAIYAGN